MDEGWGRCERHGVIYLSGAACGLCADEAAEVEVLAIGSRQGSLRDLMVEEGEEIAAVTREIARGG